MTKQKVFDTLVGYKTYPLPSNARRWQEIDIIIERQYRSYRPHKVIKKWGGYKYTDTSLVNSPVDQWLKQVYKALNVDFSNRGEYVLSND